MRDETYPGDIDKAPIGSFLINFSSPWSSILN